MSTVGDPALQWALRLALAAMFATAALHKLRDLASFAATVRNYRVVPNSFASVAAPIMPCAELVIAIGLLIPATDRAAAAGALLLLGLYSVAVATNLVRGRRDIDCGCLGPGHRQPLSEWLLVRNTATALAAGALLVPATARHLGWLDALSIAGSVVALGLLWDAANRLLETWPRVRFVGR